MDVAQTLGYCLHQFQGKIRGLLYQKCKTLLVNGDYSGVGSRNGCCIAWRIIDEGEFTEDIAWTKCLNDMASDPNFNLPLLNYIHDMTGLSFEKNNVTGTECFNQVGFAKAIDGCDHILFFSHRLTVISI